VTRHDVTPSHRGSNTLPFVKLDTGMLDSSIWMDRPAREVFITALLMAEPVEFTEPQAVIRVASLELDGWDVPPGWYGIARAAGPGIVNRSRLDFLEGLEALARLCAPEMQSRTPKWEGRRMARISGGFVLLNYDDYRQRDYGSAERTRRYRERQRNAASDVTSDGVTRNSDDVTRDRDASRSRSRSRSRSIEETKKQDKAQPPRKRCPADFQITPELRAWAATNAPDVNLERETESFRDWEFRTGRRDWPATWRTWMRKAQEAPKPTINGKHQPPLRPIAQRIRDAQLSVPAHRKQDADYIAALVGVAADQVRAELML